MTSLQLWSVIDIAALIAGLAIYLFIVGRQLTAVAASWKKLQILSGRLKLMRMRSSQGLAALTARAE